MGIQLDLSLGLSGAGSAIANPDAVADCDVWAQALATYLGTAGARRCWDRSYFVGSTIDFGTTDIFSALCDYRYATGQQVLWETWEDSNNYVRFEITAAHKLHFIAVKGGVTKIEVTGATALSTLNTWIYPAVAIDRSNADNCKVYLSGVDDTDGTAATSTDSVTNTGTLHIGASGTLHSAIYCDHKFSGLCIGKPSDVSAIQEAAAVRCYNTTEGLTYGQLTAAEIANWGVTGYWNANENLSSASLVDQHGTNDGTATFDNLLSNPGFETRAGTTWKSFAATDKVYFSVTDDAALDLGTGDIFIHARVKRSSVDTIQVILSKGGGVDGKWWVFYFDSSNHIRFDCYEGATQKTSIIGTSNLNSTTITYDLGLLIDRSNNANTKLYVNGVAEALGTNTVSEDDMDSTGSLKIGTSYDAVQFFFDGYISQVAIGKPADASAAACQTAAGTIYYNGGLGMYYGEAVAAGIHTTLGITAAWDCTDSGLTALTDQCGTNDCTAVCGELVTNGTFATDTDWSKGSGWTIDAGDSNVAEATLSDAYINQDHGATVARSYDYSYDLVTCTAGSVMIKAGSTSTASESTPGTKTGTFIQATNSSVYLEGTGFSGTIDNVSIKSSGVPTVSDTNLLTGWETSGTTHIETNTVRNGNLAASIIWDGGGNDYVLQANVTTIGRSYTMSGYAKSAGADTLIYAGETNATANAGTAVSADWTLITKTFTVSTLTSVIMYPYIASPPTPVIYFDDLVCKATVLPAANGPASAIVSDSVGNNHGVLTGFTAAQELTAFSSDVPTQIGSGYSLTFDGTDDYVSIADASGLRFDAGTLDFSIAAWIKTSQNTRAIIEKRDGNDDGWWLGIDGSGYPAFSLDAIDAAGDVDVADGDWHHVAVTVDRDGNMQLYVDGTVTGTPVAASSEAMATTAAVLLGKDSVATTYFAGSIDDIRIYDTVLSAAEVAQLAAGTDVTSGLVSKWACDDGPFGVPVDGDPVVEWITAEGSRYQLQQTTVAYRPAFELTGVNSLPSLDFDGSSTYMRCTTTTPLHGTAGLLDYEIRPNSVGSEMAVFAASDEAAANEYLVSGIDAAGKVFIEVNDSGTTHRVTGNTVLSAGSDYHVQIWSDDSAWYMRVNGVDQTLTVIGANSGKWFGDLAGLDAWTVGCLNLSTGVTKYFDGLLAEKDFFTAAVSASNRSRIRNYYSRRYSS